MAVWTNTANLNVGRADARGFGTPLTHVLVGGFTTWPTCLADGEKYNGTSWTTINATSIERRLAGGSGTASAGLCFGGEKSQTSQTLNGTEEYNGTSWTTKNNMTHGVSGMGSCGTVSAALSVGGFNTQANNIDDNCYSFNGTSWSTTTVYPTNVNIVGATGTGSAALSVGGTTNHSDALTSAYKFNGTSFSATGSIASGKRGISVGGSTTLALAAKGALSDGTNTSTSERFNGTSFSNSYTANRAGFSASTTGNISGSNISLMLAAPTNWHTSTEYFADPTIVTTSALTSVFSLPSVDVPVSVLNQPDSVTLSLAAWPPVMYIPALVLPDPVLGNITACNAGVQIVLIQPDQLGITITAADPLLALPFIVLVDAVSAFFALPDPDIQGKTVMIAVTGFQSGKTVSYKIINDAGAVLQDWTTVGVQAVVIDASAAKAAYFVKTSLIAQDFQGTVFWKTNDSPPKVASESFNIYQSYMINVRGKTNIIPEISDKISMLQADAGFLLACIRNEKGLKKIDGVWYLIIYDDAGSGAPEPVEILRKALKDKDGNNITDLAAGVLARELSSSVV